VVVARGARVAGPVAAAAAYALGEPEPVVARGRRAAALHGAVAAAAHRAVLASGALARPPQAGRHLYADLSPLAAGLAERGVTDAMELEDHLSARIGAPAPGGHRFGDDLAALRVRFATGMLLGSTQEQRLESLTAVAPLELPHVIEALSIFGAALDELR
jgi:hypothetical protein